MYINYILIYIVLKYIKTCSPHLTQVGGVKDRVIVGVFHIHYLIRDSWEDTRRYT